MASLNWRAPATRPCGAFEGYSSTDGMMEKHCVGRLIDVDTLLGGQMNGLSGRTHTHARAHIFTFTHTHTYAHIRAHIHTHTHTHTHIEI